MKPNERIILLMGFVALAQACNADKGVVGPGGVTRIAADAVERPLYSDWSAPVNLGPVVNSGSNEQHPAISKDGLSLYFASDRAGAGGMGGLDIYVSHRESLDAPWGAPVNLGPNINSAGNDLAPTFSPDGHLLYFHSNGRGGCGGADLFVSRRHDKRDDFGWELAEDLGCVVNSPFNDAGPTIFEDEATGITTLYFTVQNNPPSSDQGFDIYASTRTGDKGRSDLPSWSRSSAPRFATPARRFGATASRSSSLLGARETTSWAVPPVAKTSGSRRARRPATPGRRR